MHRFPDVPRIVFNRRLLEAPASGDLPATVVQKVDIQREDRWNKVKETFRRVTIFIMCATWLVTLLIFMKETLFLGFDTIFSDVCPISAWMSQEASKWLVSRL